MNRDTYDMIARLERLGIGREDCFALRRISMTLHRWHELECGNDYGAIERDGNEPDSKPYMRRAYWLNGKSVEQKWAIPDRETGARKRLAAIMERYKDKGLIAYVQGDPRGAALYILKPGDVPEGAGVDSYYSRGVAVYA